MNKIYSYCVAAPRWFALPFFLGSLLLGAELAGGIVNTNVWIVSIGAALLMAGGHTLNGWGDWITGLDQGECNDRSAEKDYTGGQSLIASGFLGLRETFILGMTYYLLSLVPIIYVALKVSWIIIPLTIIGMSITFWYSLIAKFNWTHETALAIGVGPVPVLMGMFAVNPNPPWIDGLLVSVPIAVILSYLGLALDEYPDAEANLKKGVKSVAYMVWKYGVSIEWYVSTWLSFVLVYQVFLIQLGILKPLTGLAFIPVAVIIPLLVMMKGNFRKTMGYIVLIAAFYPILLLIGQVVGG